MNLKTPLLTWKHIFQLGNMIFTYEHVSKFKGLAKVIANLVK